MSEKSGPFWPSPVDAPANRQLFGDWLLQRERWMKYAVLWRFFWLTEEDREDIAGESKLRAIVSHDIGSFPLPCPDCRKFLWRITYNCAVDWNTKKNPDRIKDIPPGDPDDPRPGLEDLIAVEEGGYTEVEDRIVLEECIEKLPEPIRTTIKLKRQDYTQQEIASIMGRSVSVINDRIQKGRAMLQRCVNGEE